MKFRNFAVTFVSLIKVKRASISNIFFIKRYMTFISKHVAADTEIKLCEIVLDCARLHHQRCYCYMVDYSLQVNKVTLKV